MRFYSLPPRELYYPYLMLTMKNRNELDKRHFDHAIVDSGIEIFAKKHVTDYPLSFLHRYEQRAEILTHKFKEKVWVTIPDYCDDLNPNQIKNNVKKTIKNIREYLPNKNVNWLPVIQSKNFNRFSLLENLSEYQEVLGDYPRVAIGTVCKARNLKFIVDCCKIVKKFFPDKWLHAFGLTLAAVQKCEPYLNSWDSQACYFPRKPFKQWSKETGFKPFPNGNTRIFFFNAYLEAITKKGVQLDD